MAKPMYYWNGTTWEEVAPVVPQSPIAYQASAPSTPSTGDLWIDSDQDLDTYQRQLVRYKFIASGGETSLSGADANSAVLSYTPGAEQVYLNGALLVRGSDYVATNGTSITSLAALSVNDVVEIFAYVAFNVANTYTQSQVDGLVAPMGLVHINTFTVSGASSHSFGSDTNPIFSSSYDNYQIVVFCTSGSGGILNLRLRANITDLTSTVYDWQETLGNGTSGAFQRQTSQTTARVNGGGSNDNASTIINLFNPFLARDKSFSSIINYAASPLSGVYGGNIRSAVSYNGFSLIGNSGNFNAKVSIYGWKI